MLSRAGVPPGQDDFLSHMPIDFQRFRKRSFVPLKGAADDQAYRTGFAKVLEVIAMCHRQGIRLLPGSDDPTGFSVRREVALYVKADMASAGALRAATLGSEEYLGRTDRPTTIARGKLADMVLVPGDPTRDMPAIKRPRLVIKSGAVYFPSEIYTALGIAPFANPPAIRPAKPMAATVATGRSVGFGYEDVDHDD